MGVLVSQHTNVAAQVRIANMTNATQLGDNVSASLETAAADDIRANRVINAWGSVYVSHYDGIYRLQEGSREGEWSKLSADGGLTFTGLTGAGTSISHGPYFTVIDDEPYIFGVYWLGTSTNWRIWKINLLKDYSDPTRNTISGTISVGTTPDFPRSSIFFNGLLIATVKNTAGPSTIAVDPYAMSISNIWNTSLQINECSFDIFNKNLYVLTVNTSPNPDQVIINAYTSTGMFQLFTLESASHPNASSQRYQLLFNDEENMYALYLGGTGGNGWKLREIIDTNGTLSLGSDLTTTVLPSELRSGTYSTGRWVIHKEQNDGTRNIYLYYATSTTSVWYKLQWQGSSQQLTQIDSGLASSYALPNNSYGGGDRTFEYGRPTMAIYKKQRTIDGERITFRVFPPQIGSIENLDLNNLTVRFYYGTDHEISLAQASLTGTATGGSAVRVNNEVTNVAADGITDYTVIIQAVGFEDNDKIELVGRVS